MKSIIFNSRILEALYRCGFSYCYSKTVADEIVIGKVSIFLTPIYSKPDIRRLPIRYDTYFNLNKEPRQMAMGIDEETTVYVNVEETVLKKIIWVN